MEWHAGAHDREGQDAPREAFERWHGEHEVVWATSVIVENTFFTFFYFFYKKVIKSYKKLKKVEKKNSKNLTFFTFL